MGPLLPTPGTSDSTPVRAIPPRRRRPGSGTRALLRVDEDRSAKLSDRQAHGIDDVIFEPSGEHHAGTLCTTRMTQWRDPDAGGRPEPPAERFERLDRGFLGQKRGGENTHVGFA